ncbi:unnamed protein product [Urochloa humidicola]
MTTPNVPSMNAMVDSITDAVESAIIRGNHSGGVRRFMVQGAVLRALRDIHFNQILTRRSTSNHEHRSSRLRVAHGHVQHARNTGRAPPQPLATLSLTRSPRMAPPPPPTPLRPHHRW